MKLLAVVIAIGITASLATASTPNLGRRVSALERKVSALRGQLVEIQRHQQTAAQAFDIQRQGLDKTRAGLGCLTSWVGTVDGMGACELLNIPETPPNYKALIGALGP